MTRGRGFVFVLASLAAVAVAGAAALSWRSVGLDQATWMIAGAIALAMLAFERQGFVFYWRELGTKISLDEVALFVGLAYLPPPLLVLCVAAASTANQIMSRRAPLKSAFNVSQHTLAAAVAAAVVTAVARLDLGALAHATAGTIAYAVVTPAILSALFGHLERASPLHVFRERFGGSTVASAFLGVALGSIAVALWDRAPVAIVAILPVLFFLRRFGHLSAWADEELRAAKRLAGVSTTIAGRSDLDGVADRILAACGDLFACGEAHLALDVSAATRRSWTRSFEEGATGVGGVSVPVLGADGREIGALSVFPQRTGHAYGERERYLLSTVAASAAAAAANANALALVESKNAELVSSERRYRGLFESSNALFHVLDDEGRVVEANAACAAALGVAADVLRGRRIEDFVHPTDRDRVRAALAGLGASAEVRGVEARFVAGDGSEVVALLDARAFADPDGRRRVVGCLRDITELKALEVELRRAMGAQAETIRRLENANRELEDFTLWTTHDMREPLRSVGTLAKALADEISDIPRDEARDLARRIHLSSERLKDRVKGLHAFSLIVQNDVPFENVNLAEVAEAVVASLDTRIRERHARVVLRGPVLPVVRAQPHRIDQVLTNLVENALKYAGRDGATIEIGCAEQPDGWRVFVRDDGVGIAREYHERIFQLFQRGPSAEQEPGSGAGLAIVKRIVEQHGGRAWVESAPGAGATFAFTLPRATIAPIVPALARDGDRRATPASRAAPERGV